MELCCGQNLQAVITMVKMVDADVFQSLYSPQKLIKECVNDAISYGSYDLYPVVMETELLPQGKYISITASILLECWCRVPVVINVSMVA